MQNLTTEQILSRALWLAFSASRAVGMGTLHMGLANAQTEESLFREVVLAARNPSDIDTDYVYGRMMKTTFIVKDGEVSIRPNIPRLDYQSWGSTYDSGEAIIAAAKQSLSA